jgi:pentalenolactone synthase
VTAAEAALPTMPFERPDVLDVAPLYRVLQAEHPVTRVRAPAGGEAWLVTRYEDVRALFLDERLSWFPPDPERAPRITNFAMLDGASGRYDDPGGRSRMRAALEPSFSAKRMRALAPHIQELVDGLLDRLATAPRPADLHEELSYPLPAMVIGELLGVPPNDRERCRAWLDAVADTRDRARGRAGLEALRAYMGELIEEKRRAPGEDVISDLLAGGRDGRSFSDREILGWAAGLLFAGHETTVARIDMGTLLLLAHPGERDALRRDPSLVPRAVEEILRMAVPGDGPGGLPRYAHADLEVAGVTIRRGDAVLLAGSIANRDPRVVADSDRFDVARERTAHLTFGLGPHFCLGASLARMELQAVFGTLFTRFPSLRLAVPLERLRLRTNRIGGGLVELPVAW